MADMTAASMNQYKYFTTILAATTGVLSICTQHSTVLHRSGLQDAVVSPTASSTSPPPGNWRTCSSNCQSRSWPQFGTPCCLLVPLLTRSEPCSSSQMAALFCLQPGVYPPCVQSALSTHFAQLCKYAVTPSVRLPICIRRRCSVDKNRIEDRQLTPPWLVRSSVRP